MSAKKLKHAMQWRGEPLSVIARRWNIPTNDFVSEGVTACGFDPASPVLMHPRFTWANIVTHIGLFPSAGQARKAGWDMPIAPGYAEAVFRRQHGDFAFVRVYK